MKGVGDVLEGGLEGNGRRVSGGAFAGIAEAVERRRAERGKIAEFKLLQVRGSA